MNRQSRLKFSVSREALLEPCSDSWLSAALEESRRQNRATLRSRSSRPEVSSPAHFNLLEHALCERLPFRRELVDRSAEVEPKLPGDMRDNPSAGYRSASECSNRARPRRGPDPFAWRRYVWNCKAIACDRETSSPPRVQSPTRFRRLTDRGAPLRLSAPPTFDRLSRVRGDWRAAGSALRGVSRSILSSPATSSGGVLTVAAIRDEVRSRPSSI